MSGRVLLAVTPFLPLYRPALGVSLLKSQCEAREIRCDIVYFTFDYATLIGLEDYTRIDGRLPTKDLCGEWLFAEAAFGAALPESTAFQREVLDRAPVGFYDVALNRRLHEHRQLSKDFIARCVDSLDLDAYDVVGATSTFQQNTSSIAFLSEVKRRQSRIVTVLGGGNADGEMGSEWIQLVEELDAVISGEADWIFPEFVSRIQAGEPVDDLPGVLTGSETTSSTATPVTDLDALPFPDFEDYFKALARYPDRDRLNVELAVETSRGCWWGQKHQCTFCGLNGTGINYRFKSPRRAFDEVMSLSDTWQVQRFFAADNIIHPGYFDTVFRWIRDNGRSIDLQYEMKATLHRAQLRAMKESGTTWFQPGIESLSTHVLQLMDKGTTAIQNVQVLKWARELGFKLTWNVLCGFPGETRADYEDMLMTMRMISHLEPPASFTTFRVDRFSPMYDRAAELGITNVRPGNAYELCYPFSEDSIRRIAYFFDCDRDLDPDAILAANQAWLFCTETWAKQFGSGTLAARVSENLVLVEDSRPGWTRTRDVLVGLNRSVLLAADSVQTAESILETVRRRECESSATLRQVEAALQHLVARGWVMHEGDSYLSLTLFVGCADDELGPVRQSAPRLRELVLLATDSTKGGPSAALDRQLRS